MTKIFSGVSLLVFCLLTGCGNGEASSGSSGVAVAGNGNGSQANSVCYLGSDQKNTTCLPLVSIEATSLGYKDPHAEKTNPLPAGEDPKQYAEPLFAINLGKVNSQLFLAPDFRLIELMSSIKDSFGIFSPAVLKIVQQLRNIANTSIDITSGFRSPEYNVGVSGSAVWSRHEYGDAVDIESSTLTAVQLQTICNQLHASFTSLYVPPDRHVHCDWRGVELDPNFYGPSISPGKLAGNREQVHQKILENFVQTTQIVVQGDLRVGNIVLLSSVVPMQEDPGQLYKKWTITAPNGQVLELENQEVSLPLSLRGNYQVVHDVAGVATLTKTLTVR